MPTSKYGVSRPARERRADQMEAGVQKGGMHVIRGRICQQRLGQHHLAQCFTIAPPDVSQATEISAKIEAELDKLFVIIVLGNFFLAAGLDGRNV